LLFDMIVATHVLEHVEDPVAVLKRARGWLTPRGRVLIIVPNATSLHRQLAVRMAIQPTVYSFSPRDRQVGHVRVYDLQSLRRDIEAAGLTVVAQRGLFLKILPNHMMAGFSDELLRALVDISDDLPTDLMANLALVAQPTGMSA
jgi:2-polyprenyl-3-methyl-5-hydroxy-6-metoxy-1,4-benzoquinol methylase